MSNYEGNTAASRNQHRKRQVLRAMRADQGCKDCGRKNPVVLHFHHRDPFTKNPRLKKSHITKLAGLGWEDMMKEVEKCDVLCANCHLLEEDRLRRGYPIKEALSA